MIYQITTQPKSPYFKWTSHKFNAVLHKNIIKFTRVFSTRFLKIQKRMESKNVCINYSTQKSHVSGIEFCFFISQKVFSKFLSLLFHFWTENFPILDSIAFYFWVKSVASCQRIIVWILLRPFLLPFSALIKKSGLVCLLAREETIEIELEDILLEKNTCNQPNNPTSFFKTFLCLNIKFMVYISLWL